MLCIVILTIEDLTKLRLVSVTLLIIDKTQSYSSSLKQIIKSIFFNKRELKTQRNEGLLTWKIYDTLSKTKFMFFLITLLA